MKTFRQMVQLPALPIRLPDQRFVQMGEADLRVTLPAHSLVMLPADFAETVISEGAGVGVDVTLPARMVEVPIDAEPFVRAALKATGAAWGAEMEAREKEWRERPINVKVSLPDGAVQVQNTVQPAPVTVVREGARTVTVERDPSTGRLSGATVSGG